MTSELGRPASFDVCFQNELARIEQGLERVLPPVSERPERLCEAMRYSVLNGGKRVRPLLTLLVSDMLKGNAAEGLLPACAVELIHSYSLIHDDLPCLDNDEFRRGQLTCHKKFGEAVAILAGDALFTLAFQVLGEMKDPVKAKRIVCELAQAAGYQGMVGGQVLEMLCAKEDLDLPTLESIHIQKTGQLIRASCLAGAIAAGAAPQEEVRIVRFGEYLGFAFQIVDDILDGDGLLRFMGAHEAKDAFLIVPTSAVRTLVVAKFEYGALRKLIKIDHITTLIISID